jgi:hypothetical protein
MVLTQKTNMGIQASVSNPFRHIAIVQRSEYLYLYGVTGPECNISASRDNYRSHRLQKAKNRLALVSLLLTILYVILLIFLIQLIYS